MRLSDKHGVNPSLLLCFYCGKHKGVAMLGRLPNDEEAPREMCVDMEPCDECKAHMQQGILFIQVKDNTDPENPYRTGMVALVTEEAVKLGVKEPLLSNILTCRFAFIDESTWERIGLPKNDNTPGGNTEEKPVVS